MAWIQQCANRNINGLHTILFMQDVVQHLALSFFQSAQKQVAQDFVEITTQVEINNLVQVATVAFLHSCLCKKKFCTESNPGCYGKDVWSSQVHNTECKNWSLGWHLQITQYSVAIPTLCCTIQGEVLLCSYIYWDRNNLLNCFS